MTQLQQLNQFLTTIQILYQSHFQMVEQFSLQAFIFVIILLIYVFTSHVVQHKRVPYLHQSTMAIFMGILTSIFTKYGLKKQIIFSNQLFFTIMLPPMIFSSGYSLRKTNFFQNFGIVSFYGIVGTLIEFICMACFLMLINRFIFQTLTLNEVLMLSSILCATETVAVVSQIKSTKYPVLNAVVFGEGILKDAVGIILFHVISELKLGENNVFSAWTILEMMFNFTYLFVFSVAFGTISGFGLSYLFKKMESFTLFPIKQSSLILLNGYFTYLMGDLLGLSGIITLFTCSIIMGHYTFMNISQESQKGTGLAFQTVGYIAEAFVFAYLGASILSIQGKFMAVIMALLILAFVPFIRVIIVYLLPLVYKLFKKSFPLNSKQLKVFWFSGMIRGAISFALCLQIQSQDKKYITTIGLVIVLITTVTGSMFLKKFVKYTGLSSTENQTTEEKLFESLTSDKCIKKLTQSKTTVRLNSISSMIEHNDQNTQQTEPEKENTQQNELESASPFVNRFGQFEQKFIKPIFSKSNKKITYELQENQQKYYQNKM